MRPAAIRQHIRPRRAGDRKAAQLACLMLGAGRNVVERPAPPAIRSVSASAPPVGHMPREPSVSEQFARHMIVEPLPDDAMLSLPGLAGIGNQFGDRLDGTEGCTTTRSGKRMMPAIGSTRAGNRIEFFVKRGVDGVARRHEESV
jgi:hypothetical protein